MLPWPNGWALPVLSRGAATLELNRCRNPAGKDDEDDDSEASGEGVWGRRLMYSLKL